MISYGSHCNLLEEHSFTLSDNAELNIILKSDKVEEYAAPYAAYAERVLNINFKNTSISSGNTVFIIHDPERQRDVIIADQTMKAALMKLHSKCSNAKQS